jgi:hypothetical protein
MQSFSWKKAYTLAVTRPGAVFRTVLALMRGELRRFGYRLTGRRIRIGSQFRVHGRLEIRGPGTVIFGNRCEVISSRLAPTTIYTHHPDAVIRFGDRVRLTGTRIGCERAIEVGDWSGISDARLMDTDFHALEVYDQPRYNTVGLSKPITIGRNVWIGAGAMVLKGVRIGENSVVGAGAVVAQHVPANTVVFGNPARVVWRLRGANASSASRDSRAAPVEEPETGEAPAPLPSAAVPTD